MDGLELLEEVAVADGDGIAGEEVVGGESDGCRHAWGSTCGSCAN